MRNKLQLLFKVLVCLKKIKRFMANDYKQTKLLQTMLDLVLFWYLYPNRFL
jgi:hypothetical protein